MDGAAIPTPRKPPSRRLTSEKPTALQPSASFRRLAPPPPLGDSSPVVTSTTRRERDLSRSINNNSTATTTAGGLASSSQPLLAVTAPPPGGGGGMSTSISAGSFLLSGDAATAVSNAASAQATASRTSRLNNQLREKFDSMKRIAGSIKKTELCDITYRMLDDWSSHLQQLVVECDDLVATLPTRIAEMDMLAAPGGGGGMAGGSSSRRVSGAQASRSPINSGLSPLALPLLSQPSEATASSLAQAISPNGTGAISGGGGPGALMGRLIPDIGILSQVISPPSEASTDKMKLLALSVHVCLDAAARALNAEKASICMPIRGVKEDLRSVCSVGFDRQGEHHPHRPGPNSAEVLCVRSGIMIVCSHGTNPPVELDIRSALAFFQRQARDDNDPVFTDEAIDTTISQIPRQAAKMLVNPGSIGRTIPTSLNSTVALGKTMTTQSLTQTLSSPSQPRKSDVGSPFANTTSDVRASTTIVTALKSHYWSKIVCPIRLNNSTNVIGVVTFLNKDGGHSNFTTDDETIVFGVATTLAGMLARCHDVELFSRSYQRKLPIPVFPGHLASSTSIPGSRNQLVYRTRDPNSGKDIKILLNDGKAERLDNHTSLMSIAEYIQRMQQSWRDAVLLNAELRRTHEDRTRVVTSLLVRARTSELKNTVLEQERVHAIPDDDELNAQFFRDYAQFKKHRARLEVIAEEDRLHQGEERIEEDRRLKQMQEDRQRKYRAGSRAVAATSPDPAGGGAGSVGSAALSQLLNDNAYGSDDDDEDVYAKAADTSRTPLSTSSAGRDDGGGGDGITTPNAVVSPLRRRVSVPGGSNNAYDDITSPMPAIQVSRIQTSGGGGDGPSMMMLDGAAAMVSVATSSASVVQQSSLPRLQLSPTLGGSGSNHLSPALGGGHQLATPMSAVEVSGGERSHSVSYMSDQATPVDASRTSSSYAPPPPGQAVLSPGSLSQTGLPAQPAGGSTSRDYKESQKAKELLFGRSPPPPPLLDP